MRFCAINGGRSHACEQGGLAVNGRRPSGAARAAFRRGVFFPAALAFLLAILSAGPAGADEYDVRGKASWYGTTAHGKQTASGETFDKHALTAAHKTLPFGTVLRVYNLRNKRHTLVRVNDRGPFIAGRIVDVSRRAAEQLKMMRAGVTAVAIEVISNARGEPLNRENSFYLHVADEKNLVNAFLFASQLSQRVNQPSRTLFSLQEARPTYSICLGPYDTFDQAESVYMTMEKRKIFARGIIEGPARGRDIPRHVPPSAKKKEFRPKKVAGKAGERGETETGQGVAAFLVRVLRDVLNAPGSSADSPAG